MDKKSSLDDPIHKDSRGEIIRHNINDAKFNILTSKAGSFRSGDFHPTTQFDLILKGEVKITMKKDNDDIVTIKKDNEFVSIPKDTPHLFEFTKDTVMIEWWDGPFEIEYYKPYRDIVSKSFENGN
jgi:mannose-6-phosphate isomerase-like protein (cupin superfamily)